MNSYWIKSMNQLSLLMKIIIDINIIMKLLFLVKFYFFIQVFKKVISRYFDDALNTWLLLLNERLLN